MGERPGKPQQVERPSGRKELRFPRKRGSVVTTSESLRVRLEGRAPRVGLATVLRDFQVVWSSAHGTSSKITANIAVPYLQ